MQEVLPMAAIKDMLVYFVAFTATVFVALLSYSVAEDAESKIKWSLMFSIFIASVLIAGFIIFSALNYAITGGK